MRESIGAVLLGFVVRLGIPLLVTLGLGRLVERWLRLPLPEEGVIDKARRQWNQALARNEVLHCWDIKKCPQEVRLGCPAFLKPDLPCWQAILETKGHLRPGCLTCNLYPLAKVAEV